MSVPAPSSDAVMAVTVWVRVNIETPQWAATVRAAAAVWGSMVKVMSVPWPVGCAGRGWSRVMIDSSGASVRVVRQ